MKHNSFASKNLSRIGLAVCAAVGMYISNDASAVTLSVGGYRDIFPRIGFQTPPDVPVSQLGAIEVVSNAQGWSITSDGDIRIEIGADIGFVVNGREFPQLQLGKNLSISGRSVSIIGDFSPYTTALPGALSVQPISGGLSIVPPMLSVVDFDNSHRDNERWHDVSLKRSNAMFRHFYPGRLVAANHHGGGHHGNHNDRHHGYKPDHPGMQLPNHGDADEYCEFPKPVPLPAAAWLFGSGLIALAGFGRRRMTGKA